MRKLLLGLVLVLGVTTFTSCEEEESIAPQCERCVVGYDPEIQGYRCYIIIEDCNEGEESNIPN